MGDGHYSKVFSSKDENFIIKMNKGNIDKEYLEFVKYCFSHKNNPHLPKIGKPKMLEGWYIIFIEKLRNASFLDIGISENDFFSYAKNLTKCYEYNNSDYVDYNWKKILDLYPNANPQILEITKLMADIIKTCNMSLDNFDLHDGNIMMRGNTIVITDPLWSGSL